MRIAFERSFIKDLKSINDRSLFSRVEKTIEQVKLAGTLDEIKQLRKMSGAETFYRLRLGDYRIGIEVSEDTIVFVRILHRKDIYRYFP